VVRSWKIVISEGRMSRSNLCGRERSVREVYGKQFSQYQVVSYQIVGSFRQAQACESYLRLRSVPEPET
jgi:hypothetical protein